MIRALELPLVLVFNAGRVMTLPQGVSKATGLHVALDMFGCPRTTPSPLAMQRTTTSSCVSRRSVSRSSGRVRRCNRWPTSYSLVAALRASHRKWVRSRRHSNCRLRRGHAASCCSDTQRLARVLTRRSWSNVLVTGDAKSGKSWVAGLLCEQLILHGYCVCVIDPDGDYSSLGAARRDRARPRGFPADPARAAARSSISRPQRDRRSVPPGP